MNVFQLMCGISAGPKIQEQGEENNSLGGSLTCPPYSKVSPDFDVILPNSKSHREVEFIEFVSNMPTYN